MPDSDMIRELRNQARIYTQAADILAGKTTTRTTTVGTPKRRQISAAGRRNIRLAQQKRWAIVKGGKRAA